MLLDPRIATESNSGHGSRSRALRGDATDDFQPLVRDVRSLVAEMNVYRWAGRMLVDAAQFRRRERLTGRLSQSFGRGRREEV